MSVLAYLHIDKEERKNIRSMSKKKIDKFWTITAVDTIFCNDRSQRFYSLDSAVQAASERVANGTKPQGVIVMEAVKLVLPLPPQPLPVTVTDV